MAATKKTAPADYKASIVDVSEYQIRRGKDGANTIPVMDISGDEPKPGDIVQFRIDNVLHVARVATVEPFPEAPLSEFPELDDEFVSQFKWTITIEGEIRSRFRR